MNAVNMNNVNSALKSAAASTKSVADSAAHAISSLVEEAQDRLSDVSVPAIHIRRKKRRRGLVFGLLAAGAGVAYGALRLMKGRSAPAKTSDANTFVENESPFTLQDSANSGTGSTKDPARTAAA